MPRSNQNSRIRKAEGKARWKDSAGIDENMKRIETQMSRFHDHPAIRHSESDKITPQELVFVHYYLAGNPAGTAAVNSGYERKRGAKLLEQPHIQEEIAKRRAALTQLQIMDKQGLIAELLVMFNDLGNDRNDVLLKVKIIETIAKMQSYFTPDTQVNVGTHTNHIKIEIVKPHEHNLPEVIEIHPEPEND